MKPAGESSEIQLWPVRSNFPGKKLKDLLKRVNPALLCVQNWRSSLQPTCVHCALLSRVLPFRSFFCSRHCHRHEHDTIVQLALVAAFEDGSDEVEAWIEQSKSTLMEISPQELPVVLDSVDFGLATSNRPPSVSQCNRKREG
jgi:hypothetical protein